MNAQQKDYWEGNLNVLLDIMINNNWRFLDAYQDSVDIKCGRHVEIKCPFTASHSTVE